MRETREGAAVVVGSDESQRGIEVKPTSPAPEGLLFPILFFFF